MKEKHFRIVAIDKKTVEEFDKERIVGTLIERIIFLLDSGIEKEIQKNLSEIDQKKKEIQIRELLILELRAVLGKREKPVSQ